MRGSVGRGSARAEARDVTKGQSDAAVPRLGRSIALPSLALPDPYLRLLDLNEIQFWKIPAENLCGGCFHPFGQDR